MFCSVAANRFVPSTKIENLRFNEEQKLRIKIASYIVLLEHLYCAHVKASHTVSSLYNEHDRKL